MRLGFRHGIVSCQSNFLTISGRDVVINAGNRPLVVTIAHGNKNYLFEEPHTITAWNGIGDTVTPLWLFMEFSTLGFQRVFGSASSAPILSTTRPGNPTEGTYWFDQVSNRGFEFRNSGWKEVIRIYVAQLSGGVFTSVSDLVPIFTGTQIGISNVRLDTNGAAYIDEKVSFESGNVLFNENGLPVATSDGTFLTTGDKFFVAGSRASSVNLEASIVKATCDQPAIFKNSVVVFVAPGRIRTCQYENVGFSLIGVLTENLVAGETGSVIVQGMVYDETWAFTSDNMNKPLWVDNGHLVNEDPHTTNLAQHPVKRPPVGRIAHIDAVFFMQGLGLKGDPGDPFSGEIPHATDTMYGVTRLNRHHPDALVVVDDDPRLSDSRDPNAHTHVATDVNYSQSPLVPAGNLQDTVTYLADFADSRVLRAGDTMTGNLTLNANPSQPLHAATKDYVDMLAGGLNVIPPVQTVNLMGDLITLPPNNAQVSDAYVVPVGSTDAWSTLEGHVVFWDGNFWQSLGALTDFPPGSRFGIAVETGTVPTGTFASHENDIAILQSTSPVGWAFYTPSKGDVFYVNNPMSPHAFHQYAFSGTEWSEFGRSISFIPGTNMELDGHILNVSPQGPMSNLHADIWDGQHAEITNVSEGEILTYMGGVWRNTPLMMKPRNFTSFTTPNLVPNETYEFQLVMAPAITIYKLEVSSPCMVKAFATAARNDTNPFTFIAYEGHLEDDGSWMLADGTLVFGRRYTIIFNLETPISETIYWSITNTDTAQRAISMSVMYLPME